MRLALALLATLLLPAAAGAVCDSVGAAACRHDCGDTRITDLDAAGAAFETCFGKCAPGHEGRVCRNACRPILEAAITTALENLDNCLDACVTANRCSPAKPRSRIAGLDGFSLPVPGDTRAGCAATQAEVCAGPCADQRVADVALITEEFVVCVAGCPAGASGAACRRGCRTPFLDGANEAAAAFATCANRCDAEAGCDAESDAAAVSVAGIADFPFHDLALFGVATSRRVSTQAPRAAAAPPVSNAGRADGASLRR